MNKQTAITKAVKLLAQAESYTTGEIEANTFHAKARELCRTYRITQGDLTDARVSAALGTGNGTPIVETTVNAEFVGNAQNANAVWQSATFTSPPRSPSRSPSPPSATPRHDPLGDIFNAISDVLFGTRKGGVAGGNDKGKGNGKKSKSKSKNKRR